MTRRKEYPKAIFLAQMVNMSKVMVGRRDEENFSMGLIDASEDYLKLASVDEPAGLGDIVEYLL